MVDTCDAGREAMFEGRWVLPCLRTATNVLGIDGDERRFKFCQQHMDELILAGLIDAPFMDEGEWKARYARDNPSS